MSVPESQNEAQQILNPVRTNRYGLSLFAIRYPLNELVLPIFFQRTKNFIKMAIKNDLFSYYFTDSNFCFFMLQFQAPLCRFDYILSN